MHEHYFHILLIIVQLLVCSFFLLRKKLSLNFLVVSLLLFSLSFYSSSARLVFAHHHESQSQSGEHPCCQPLTVSFVPSIDIGIDTQIFIYTNERNISFTPLSVLDNRSIRAPPNTTS